MRKTVKAYSLFSIILIAIILTACSDTNKPRNAQYITLKELRVTPGYEWFDSEYGNYKLDKAVIDSIKKQFTNRKDDFILYVNPSCNCSGTQVLFPASIKVLHEAGISEQRIKIYTMYNQSDGHPYMNTFKVMSLPSFFTVIDTLPKYSINDSLKHYKLIRPDSTWVIEDFVYRAIKG